MHCRNSKPKPRPEVDIRDRAVEALYALSNDISNSRPMRQLQLFRENDERWLDSVRIGLANVVLRLALVLHAEDRGLLPLGDSEYDALLALTPIARLPAKEARQINHGAWRRLLRISSVLSGEKAPPENVSIPKWGAGLFRSSWLGPFAVVRVDATETLRPSDNAVHQALHSLQYANQELLEIEDVASVYERLIEFEIVRCSGRSIRRAKSKIVVDVDYLAEIEPEMRVRYIEELGVRLPSTAVDDVRDAKGFDELLRAIDQKNRPSVILPVGAAVLRPLAVRHRAAVRGTSRQAVRCVVHRALDPLISSATSAERLLSLRVCDPAMGTGSFLVEACRQIADAVCAVEANCSTSSRFSEGQHRESIQQIRHKVATMCLYGVDADPFAVDLARLCVGCVSAGADRCVTPMTSNLCCGDALVGLGPWRESSRSFGGMRMIQTDAVGDWGSESWLRPIAMIPRAKAVIQAHATARKEGSYRHVSSVRHLRNAADALVFALMAKGDVPRDHRGSRSDNEQFAGLSTHGVEPIRPFHWPLEFPEVFDEPRDGFDALIGCPPCAAYAGRAAQPISTTLWNHYSYVSEAFRGNRTLQSLFVHRCASLLAQGGRLGLVVPSAMSDLEGYAPTRRVLDSLCSVDDSLPEFAPGAINGDAHASVALLSTRRCIDAVGRDSGRWHVDRDGCDHRDTCTTSQSVECLRE